MRSQQQPALSFHMPHPRRARTAPRSTRTAAPPLAGLGRHLRAVPAVPTAGGLPTAACTEGSAAGKPERTLPASFRALLDEHFPLTEPAVPPGVTDRAAKVAWLRTQNMALNTRRHYRNHLVAWGAWCVANGEVPFPADPQLVAEHFVDYAVLEADAAEDGADDPWEALVAVTTVELRLAALNKLHKLERVPVPGQELVVQQVVQGLARRFGKRRRFQRAAIDLRALERMVAGAKGLLPLPARRQVAHALHHGHQVSPGQLARLVWDDITFTEAGATVLLPPGARYAQRRTLELRSGRRSDRGALEALRRLSTVAPTDTRTAVLAKADAQPLTRQGVMAMLATAGAIRDADTPPLQAARNCALLLVGWHAALRRVSLSDLRWADVTRESDGWAILLRFSKSDQAGEGHEVFLAMTDVPGYTCPATALDEWLASMTAQLGADPRTSAPDAPVFPRLRADGNLYRNARGGLAAMSGASINDLISRLAEKVGLVDERATGAGRQPGYGGHSLRAGFITECIRANIPIAEIALTTGHRSFEVLLGYFRSHQNRTDNLSRRLLTGASQGGQQGKQDAAGTQRRRSLT